MMLKVTLMANMMVRMMNDFEVNAVAIERAKEYSNIPQEVPIKQTHLLQRHSIHTE